MSVRAVVRDARGAMSTDAPRSPRDRERAAARQLIVCAPAGFEGSFARIAAEHEGVEPPDRAHATRVALEGQSHFATGHRPGAGRRRPRALL
jgi:hypothetical protein